MVISDNLPSESKGARTNSPGGYFISDNGLSEVQRLNDLMNERIEEFNRMSVWPWMEEREKNRGRRVKG